MVGKIEVVPYNSAWSESFKKEAPNVKRVLGDNCLYILHIGSTSIPGLAAKPIIDMLAIVKDITKVDDCNQQMEQLDYKPHGEDGMMFRRFFIKGSSKRTHHLHVWEENSGEISKHLLFKEYIVNHPDDYKRYEELKLKLAKLYPEDSRAYCLAKDDLVKEILRKAGYKGIVIVEPITAYEISSYKKLTNAEIDLNPTLRHFVMYIGPEIVAAACIKDQKTINFIKSIDESTKQKFLEMITRWIEQQKS
jgi:GrpB-like predicted nucleotidyltransferase (UPF0157 family)